jgi:hypothetical protein
MQNDEVIRSYTTARTKSDMEAEKFSAFSMLGGSERAG